MGQVVCSISDQIVTNHVLVIDRNSKQAIGRVEGEGVSPSGFLASTLMSSGSFLFVADRDYAIGVLG